MSIRIVADSSANLFKLRDADFCCVPMSITTDEKNYRDDNELDIEEMLSDLKSYKGKSSTACPGPGDWIDAFSGAEQVIVLPLTSKLSGSYNSAVTAADIYMKEHPERRVFVLDSLTTGPELQLLAERAGELASSGELTFDEVIVQLQAYNQRSRLAFSLASLNNFAANGRVNKVLAKSVEVLNIKIVGQASEDGDLEPMNKCRGERRAIAQLWDNMKNDGYNGGKVRIRHTQNEEMAKRLAAAIVHTFPDANIKIGSNKGLCSYYAEPGSILVGYDVDADTAASSESAEA
ncbi:MAG: DegV family protein [Lachnospiraceae bacterium]|nr:DegV family protein [Lachnospiraceae bacterium]